MEFVEDRFHLIWCSPDTLEKFCRCFIFTLSYSQSTWFWTRNYHRHIIVTKISLEHEFLKELLNLPIRTIMSWNDSHPCPLCWLHRQAHSNGFTWHFTHHNGQGLDHSITLPPDGEWYCMLLFAVTYPILWMAASSRYCFHTWHTQVALAVQTFTVSAGHIWLPILPLKPLCWSILSPVDVSTDSEL